MTDAHELQAFCEACGEPTVHVVEEDPGKCTCLACGTEQQLMVPLG